MKLFVLTLFAVGIGCSWAICLPPGCGNSFVQVADAIRPYLNNEGQKGIDKLDEGIKQLRVLIVNGDIRGQSANIKNIGAAGLIKLATTTKNKCLKIVFLQLANKDDDTANQLNALPPCDTTEAANIVCNLLNYKAQQLQKCISCK